MTPTRRPRYPMPGYIQQALVDHGLTEAYAARPPYQQNDYIGWITRGAQTATREKRLKQMLLELKSGDAYMKMPYNAKE